MPLMPYPGWAAALEEVREEAQVIQTVTQRRFGHGHQTRCRYAPGRKDQRRLSFTVDQFTGSGQSRLARRSMHGALQEGLCALGARRLLWSFGGAGVQWNPADEFCVAAHITFGTNKLVADEHPER